MLDGIILYPLCHSLASHDPRQGSHVSKIIVFPVGNLDSWHGTFDIHILDMGSDGDSC